MKRFEYKICKSATILGVKIVNIEGLNKLGMEGWEAVGVLDNERILLKREIQ